MIVEKRRNVVKNWVDLKILKKDLKIINIIIYRFRHNSGEEIGK